MIYKKLHISLIFGNLVKLKPLSTNPRMCNLYTKFVKILEICKQFSHNLVNEQGNIPSRGTMPKFSDLEVVALSLAAESESIDSEKWLFDYKLQEYKDKIPNLISRRQFNDRRKRQKCLKLRNVLLWNKKRMVIISASLILPFLLRVLGAFGEGFESESSFFVQFQLIFFAEIICNTIDSHNFADNFQRIILLLYD